MSMENLSCKISSEDKDYINKLVEAGTAKSQTDAIRVLVSAHGGTGAMPTYANNEMNELQGKYNALVETHGVVNEENGKLQKSLQDKDDELQKLRDELAKHTNLNTDVKELAELTIIRGCVHRYAQQRARVALKSGASITEDQAVSLFKESFKA
jgi:Arc/MetJ-type ribon-helix-helix transcriptional regulator